MSLTRADVEKVSLLARLRLSEEELDAMTIHLGKIVGYVEQLGELNTDGIEPMAHASPVFNIWADDVPVAGLAVEKALQNAPAQRDNLIAIPKVIE